MQQTYQIASNSCARGHPGGHEARPRHSGPQRPTATHSGPQRHTEPTAGTPKTAIAAPATLFWKPFIPKGCPGIGATSIVRLFANVANFRALHERGCEALFPNLKNVKEKFQSNKNDEIQLSHWRRKSRAGMHPESFLYQ